MIGTCIFNVESTYMYGIPMTPCFNDCEKINSFHHISYLCDLLTKLTHLTKLTMPLIYMIYTVERVNTKKGVKALIII